MALIDCPECTAQVSHRAISCPSCGCPIATDEAKEETTKQSEATEVVLIPKSRGIYIILALFFSSVGLHNFYSGYYGRGFLRLFLFGAAFFMDSATNFRSGWYLVVLVLSSLWALGEIVTTDKDVTGMAFAV
jgi:TM2 domain-containing membrane protein YozV